MGQFYKDKNSDFYNSKIVDNPAVWIVVSLVTSIITGILVAKGFRNRLIVEIFVVSVFVFAIATGYQVYQVKKYLKTFRHFISYLLNYDLVQALNTSMLNSKSSAGMVNKSYRVLPKIWLWYDSNVPGRDRPDRRGVQQLDRPI